MNTAIREMLDARVKEYLEVLNASNTGAGGIGYFRVTDKPGRRYTRIVRVEPHYLTGDLQEVSVHAFLENETGLLLKPDGWKGPVKYGAAYDLNDDKHFASLLADAGRTHAFAGGYLYAGAQSWRNAQ